MSKQVTISFYGPRALRERLDEIAMREHRSRSSLLVIWLERLIERYDAENVGKKTGGETDEEPVRA